MSRRRLTIVTAALVAFAAAPAVASAGDAGKPACESILTKHAHGKTYVQTGCGLAKVIYGRVPCLDPYGKGVTTCAFNRSSGKYRIGVDGALYAKQGQLITRRGRKGGHYVTVARTDHPGGAVKCARERPLTAHAADMAVSASGSELSGWCTTEVGGSQTNRSGLPLKSYTDGVVCSADAFHPDLKVAGIPRRLADGRITYCYPGPTYGGGLNDINGTEIMDSSMTYYGGGDYCHQVWLNGYVVPAGKHTPVSGSSFALTGKIKWSAVAISAKWPKEMPGVPA